MHGWTGTILVIDLTTGKTERRVLEASLRRDFLGGRGINSRLLYEEVPAGTSALGEHNVVIFGTGPLAGTLSPASSRCTVTAKSPLTGILGDANFGGFFGSAMKKAGYDHIIIRGKSKTPVYLLIVNEEVELRDAMHLWGENTAETERQIRREVRAGKLEIASIGQAGENLVHMACIVHGFNVAGRTGMGAVMGSKNLKAVCVSGNGKVSVAHKALYDEQRREWKKRIKESPFTAFFNKYGSAGPLDREEESGILAVRNFSADAVDDVQKVSAGNLQKYFIGSNACYACPVACIQSFEVTDGPYRGTKGAKMPEGCNSACGASCGNVDPGSLFKMYNLSNEYGIDILDFGLLMAVSMDWFENGIIGPEDTDGLDLSFGNHVSMVAMLKKIAMRDGVGNILADGAVQAAKHIGKNAIDYVSYCKGMVFGGVDVRVLKGSALCYATSTRGCDHLRGGLLVELPSKEGKPAMSEEEAIKRFGTADALSPKSYNKAGAAHFSQDMYTIADCLEVCKFITDHNGYGVAMADMGKMLHAVTGMELTVEELRGIADRVFTQERAFLAREGITKKDDVLQGKWITGSVSRGPHKGLTLDMQNWDAMLEAYYASRGWDRDTGVPTKETLERLGLSEIAKDLGRILP